MRRLSPCLPVLSAAALLLATAAAAAEVTIASIAPWSTYRPYAALGSLRGTEIMLERLNAGGGLLGQSLHNVQIDDGCDPVQAQAAVKLAIASHPVLVMGGACSTALLDVSGQLAKAGILQIVPNGPSQKITEAGIATILRMTGRGDREGAFAAELIARRWKDKRIAIADDGEDNWHEAAAAVEAGLRQRGIVPLLTRTFKSNQPSYKNLVRELADNRIEVFYVNGLPPDLGLIAREVANAKLPIQLVAGRNGRVDAVRQTAGPASIEGMMFVEHSDWTATAFADPALAAEKAAGGEVNIFVANAYAAVKIWAQAVDAAGSFDAGAVMKVIKSRQFSTVIGDLAFDAKGDLTPESEQWTWFRWHDGAVEPVN